MRPLSLFLACLSCATVQAVQTTDGPEGSPSLDPAAHPETLRDSTWFETVTARLERAEYDFRAKGATCTAWSAPNRVQALRSRLSPEGLEVVPRTTEAGEPWALTLRTGRFGRLGDARQLDAAAMVASGGRVELDHGPLTEWFENRPEGLEQGWTLDARPEGCGPISIELDVGGGFRLRVDADARGGVLVRDDVELPYAGLVAFDANGRDLETSLEVVEAGFRVVVDDTDAVYPVTVDPVLKGPNWLAESNQAGAELGFAVAAVGDLNGDGYADVAVGAHLFDAGQADEGRVWLFYGSASGLSQGSDWFAESNQAGARFGQAIAGAVDVNGDGYDDLLVAAPDYDAGQSDEGAVWAYHGSSTGVASGSSWFADGDQSNCGFGAALASAGDVNGDGFGDVAIGSPGFDQGQTNEGRVRVYYGSASGLPSVASWFVTSDQTGARLGEAVAGGGDVDADGYDDLLVGAPGFDGPELNEGRVWRFDGSAAGLPPGSSFVYECDQPGAALGKAVAGAGDVNGDGFDDVLIAAPFFDGNHLNEGRVWLFHGGVSNPLGSDWFRGSNQLGAQYGRALSSAGDVNGDGYDDVIVAAPEYDSALIDAGRAWLYLGSPAGLITTQTWTGSGPQSGARFGRSVAGVGDVNGDGFDDVLVGAPGNDAGQADEGSAYLFSGSADVGSSYCTSTPNSTGSPAEIMALHSPSASAGNLTLEASPVPNGFGLFLHAPNMGFQVLGDGFLCVSGSFVRGPVVTATNNVASFTYDNSSSFRSLVPYAGSTRYFQAWFRDATPTGFNLSDGVFVPIAH